MFDGPPLDDQGQPINQKFRAAGRRDRTVDELVGIAKALVADGKLCEAEADFLRLWLEKHSHNAEDFWPVNVIAPRVRRMLVDGVIDAQERIELFELLKQLVGGPSPVAEQVASFSTQLPLDNPPPEIDFHCRSFCFTGSFAYGVRSACQEEVRIRDGFVCERVSGDLHYLVVGCVGSRDWIHTTHGRKIEKVLELRKTGCCTCIVGEEHWVEALVAKPVPDKRRKDSLERAALKTPLAGKKFYFSGNGWSESRRLAQELGATIATNLTRKVDWVVADSIPEWHAEKIEQYCLAVISDAECEAMLKEEAGRMEMP